MKIYEYKFFNLENETYVDEKIISELSIKRYFYIYWLGDNLDDICNIRDLNRIVNFNCFHCLKKLSKNQLNKLRTIYGNESI